MATQFGLRLFLDGRALKTGAAAAKKSLAGVTASAAAASRSLGVTGAAMKGAGRIAGGLRTQILALGTAMLGLQTVRAAVKTMAEFEETMAALKGVTAATEAQFASLTKTARALGATTRFTAAQAAQGLLNLARAGFTANEAIAAVPATLNLAVAGLLSLDDASNIAANSVRQFGLEAAEATRVADVFIQTANSANVTVASLGDSMRFVGPIAGALGHSIEGTAAAIGVLGNAGLKGGIAGTNLRGVFAGLLQTTDRAKVALREMGIELEAVSPATNALVEIMDQFAESNLSAAQAVAIFGRRNAAGALVLSRNTKTLRELTKANNEAFGAAAKISALVDDTLVGAFKRLRSAVEEAFLATGDAGFAGSLRQVLDQSAEIVNALTGINGGFADVGVNAAEAAAQIKAIGGAALLLVKLKIATILLTAAMGALGTVMGAVVVGGVALAAVLIKASDETISWGDITRGVIDTSIQGLRFLENAWLDVLEAIGLAEAGSKSALKTSFEQADIDRARATEAGNLARQIAFEAKLEKERAVAVLKRKDALAEVSKALKAAGVDEERSARAILFVEDRIKHLGDEGRIARQAILELQNQVSRGRIDTRAIEALSESFKFAGARREVDLLDAKIRDLIGSVGSVGEIKNLGGSVRELGKMTDEAKRATAELALFKKALDQPLTVAGSENIQRALDLVREKELALVKARELAISTEKEAKAASGESKAAELERAQAEIAAAAAAADAREEIEKSFATARRERDQIGLANEAKRNAALLDKLRASALVAFGGDQELVNKKLAAFRVLLGEIKDRQSDVAKARADDAAKVREQAKAELELAQARERKRAAGEEVAEIVGALNAERDAIGRTTEQLEEQARVSEFARAATAFFGAGTMEATRAVEAFRAKLVQTKSDAKDFADKGLALDLRVEAQLDVGGTIEAIDAETAALALNSEEKRRAAARTEFLARVTAAYGVNTKEATRAVEEYDRRIGLLDRRTAEVAKLTQAQKLLKDVAKSIVTEIGDAFVELATGAKTAEEAIKGLFESIGKLVLQKAVASLIGGIKFADGGVFNSSGQLTPFASGGVINQPTVFPFANGIGLAGEAGPEAIIPLSRGSDGRLGVESRGGDAVPAAAGPITVNMVVQGATDPGAFKRSQSQIMQRAHREIARNRPK